MRRSRARICLAFLVATATHAVVAVPAQAVSLQVDTFADSYDGSCADGDCSLRDAIASGPDGSTILLPAGYYPLSAIEAGTPGDGSLLVHRDVTIEAEGLTGAFIDASDLGAPMFVVRGDARARVEGLTLFGATTTIGAPIAWVRAGRLTLDSVTASGGQGVRAGAMLVAAGAGLRSQDSLFLDNRSSQGPGALQVRGDATLGRTTFADNVGRRGGAVGIAAGGTLDLTNVTVARNRARVAGGGIWAQGEGTWRNVTVTRNRAPRGGGVAVGSSGYLQIGSTVVGANHAERHPQCVGRIHSLGYNVEPARGCRFRSPLDIRADPMLGAFGANGGPTPTTTLRSGSPALDIQPGLCPWRDQRGVPRRRACDAGAYERVFCRGSVVDIVGTPGPDELSGGRDPDTFLGLGGGDEFQGSLDADVGCGGRGADHLIGGPGDDRLFGGAGDDLIDGEQGEDRCDGGPGRDHLLGCER